MKKILIFIVQLSILFLYSCSSNNQFPIVRGDYLGQVLPNETPQLFAPGIISTGLYERDIAISPDGNEIYYGLAFGQIVTIMATRLVGGSWTEPEVASFASNLDYFYFEPCLSFDGSKIMFLCTRPPAGKEPKPGWSHQNIWVSDRTENGGWSEPYELGSPVNSDNAEYFPSLTQDGTLYFTRQMPKAGSAIYRSRWIDGQYTEPEKVPDPVNQEGNLYNAYISSDESFLIACVTRKNEVNAPRVAEYCVFFRGKDDVWTKGINMSELINPPVGSAISPYVSPDGRYFFFASAVADLDDITALGQPKLSQIMDRYNSPQNGSSDIYWVDARVIYELMPSKRK
jgi:hypothetical protein